MIKIVISLTLFLSAFSCHNGEEDFDQTLVENEFKVLLSTDNNLQINDTLWINGWVSSRNFDLEINDSVFSQLIKYHQIEIYKFVSPTQNYNVKDAIDSFELIYPNYEATFLGVCNNSSLTINSNLNLEGSLYKYKLGLRLIESGDYLINFGTRTKIQNVERNLNIVNNFPMLNSDSLIGFNKCNSTSSTSNISEGIFCFEVN